MVFYFHKTKMAYEQYKEGNCSKEFREDLAEKIEDAMRYLSFDEYTRSDILSFIIGEKIEYSELLKNRILTDIRYQGTEVIVPTPEMPEWRACLVGNIIDEHEYGENHEIRKGTKQFGPGTKVYLAPPQWGDGYDQIYVIGKPRKSYNLIQIIMSSSKITNFRVQKVFSPSVLKMMQKSKFDWWESDEETIDALNEMALFLNDHDFKYGTDERKKKVDEVLAILSQKYTVFNQKVSKEGQLYPIVTIQAYENCITVDYYGYVHEDASAYKEFYYQLSAEKIAQKIENQIESYQVYLNLPYHN